MRTNRSVHAADLRAVFAPCTDDDKARVLRADARAAELRSAYAARRTPSQPRGIFAAAAAMLRGIR